LKRSKLCSGEIQILIFNNPYSLIKSLEEKPQREWLRKVHECEDEKALKFFLRDKNLENINFDNKTLNLLMGMLSDTRFC
jgi:ATP-dependent RNA helicase SUPV3L1/SUV3